MKVLLIDLETVRPTKMEKAGYIRRRSFHELAYKVGQVDGNTLTTSKEVALVVRETTAIRLGLQADDLHNEQVEQVINGLGSRYQAVNTIREALEILREDLEQVDYLLAHSVRATERKILNEEFSLAGMDYQITSTVDTQGALAVVLEEDEELHEKYKTLYSNIKHLKKGVDMVNKQFGTWSLKLAYYYEAKGGEHPHNAMEDVDTIVKITEQVIEMGKWERAEMLGKEKSNHKTNRKAE